MKKGMLIAIIIAAVAALLLASFLVFLLIREAKEKKHEGLISYSTSYGGDMSGSHDSTMVSKVDDTKALITFSHADWYYQDPEIKEYYVDVQLLSDIEEIFFKEHLYRLAHAPKSNIFVLDGGTSSYSFSFADLSSTSFDDNLRIPLKKYGVIRQIHALIDEAAAAAEQLPGLVLPEEEVDVYGGNQYTEGEVSICANEYSRGVLYFRVGNGTKEDISLQKTVRIYRLHSEDTREVIYEQESDKTVSIRSSYADDFYCKLEKRLEAGDYLLEMGNLSIPFEIR